MVWMGCAPRCGREHGMAYDNGRRCHGRSENWIENPSENQRSSDMQRLMAGARSRSRGGQKWYCTKRGPADDEQPEGGQRTTNAAGVIHVAEPRLGTN